MTHHLMYAVTIPADAPQHAGQTVEVNDSGYLVALPVDGYPDRYFFRVCVQDGAVRVLDSAEHTEELDQALDERRRAVTRQARSAWSALTALVVLGGGLTALGAWCGARSGRRGSSNGVR